MDDATIPFRVEALENAHARTSATLERIANDLHTLALAEARRAEDQRVIEKLVERVDALEEHMHEVVLAAATQRADDKDTELRRFQERRADVWKLVLANIFTILTAFILYHFGVK